MKEGDKERESEATQLVRARVEIEIFFHHQDCKSELNCWDKLLHFFSGTPIAINPNTALCGNTGLL